MLPLEQALKLEVWVAFVEEEDLDVDVVAGWVEKVLQEGLHGLEVDVAAHDNVLPPVGLVLAGVPEESSSNLHVY